MALNCSGGGITHANTMNSTANWPSKTRHLNRHILSACSFLLLLFIGRQFGEKTAAAEERDAFLNSSQTAELEHWENKWPNKELFGRNERKSKFFLDQHRKCCCKQRSVCSMSSELRAKDSKRNSVLFFFTILFLINTDPVLNEHSENKTSKIFIE